MHHQLSTIMMLAAQLGDEPDAGPQSRRLARLILGEARWLQQLQRALDSQDVRGTNPYAHPVRQRLDDVGQEVVDAVRSSTLARVSLAAEEVYGRVSRLALWRALRNVLDNAVRAAGRDGHIEVRIYTEQGWVIIEVDDDGPGFGAGASGRSGLGLKIVQEFLASAGGQLEITAGLRGGCRVRMAVPDASPPSIDGGARGFASAAES